jgi:hypothetical protein
MNKLYETFGREHVILPVIHVASEGQAMVNAKIAMSAGADGVFLINGPHLSDIAWSLHKAMPGMWIGANYLHLMPHEAMYYAPEWLGGIWCDTHIVSQKDMDQPYAKELVKFRKKIPWQGILFGGCAFKYQPLSTSESWLAAESAKYMEVPTTSGKGTGSAPSVEKIKNMSDVLGDVPLAIASGLTPWNVVDFLPYAKAFLVATGVSKSFNSLDFDLLSKFVRAVRTGKKPEGKPPKCLDDLSVSVDDSGDYDAWWLAALRNGQSF